VKVNYNKQALVNMSRKYQASAFSIAETTGTLSYEYLVNTSHKFHQILRWSCWNHFLNWH